MTIKGWQKHYSDILKSFGYSYKRDVASAKILNCLLFNKFPLTRLEKIIRNNTVFVVGAGPSLLASLPILKKFKNIPIIVADGATKALIDAKIYPDIVVTDLDGDEKSLKKVGQNKSIIVVHAHGNNFDKLHLVLHFENCVGTTQTKSFGSIYNFGGFTDGDRCVFLAHHFHARRIILFGMDFGAKIGKYSKYKIKNKKIKIKKLREGKKLLEWLASKNSSKFFTTSKPINGFKKINYYELKTILRAENAF